MISKLDMLLTELGCLKNNPKFQPERGRIPSPQITIEIELKYHYPALRFNSVLIEKSYLVFVQNFMNFLPKRASKNEIEARKRQLLLQNYIIMILYP